MADSGLDPILIPDVAEERCDGVLTVKVDRVFFTEVVHYLKQGCRPLKEVASVDVVLFDRTGTRILVVMDDDSSVALFGSLFLEDRCYRIRKFSVVRDGKGFHSRFHLKLRSHTLVERSWEILPKHCFDFITVTDFARGLPGELGIIDICGTMRTLYETGMGEVAGVYGKKVFIVLEDNELSSVWGNKALTCCIHGACVEPTLVAYKAVTEAEGIFVVIQYAMPSFSIDGGLPTITSYCDATRVFFDPYFPVVLHHRKKMLGEPFLTSASCPLPESPE